MSPNRPNRTFSTGLIQQFEILRNNLIEILVAVENHKTAVEEYRRSLRTLLNVGIEQIPESAPPVRQYCVYLPYNNVLYSYVLYALVPSLLAERVFVRPAYLTSEVALQIHRLLVGLVKNQIILEPWSRRQFLAEVVGNSEVIAFTGKYSNLPEVAKKVRSDQLLLYGGDGLVSFVVHEDADVECAVEGAISDRLYSSGQDCICPDIFLIHVSLLDRFLERLKSRLGEKRFGVHSDRAADYSPILKADVVSRVSAFLAASKERILYGGQVDAVKQVISPTIILENDLRDFDFFEFYSPVFRIFPYESSEQIMAFFDSPFLEELKFGVSVFGGTELVSQLRERKYVVAHNRTFLDLEDGNTPFGGYGVRASHVQINGKREARPILVSREILRYFGSSRPINKTRQAAGFS